MNSVNNTETERRSWREVIMACSGTANDRRNQYWFVGWCLSWAISFTAMTQYLLSDHGLSAQMAWALAAVPNVFGVLTLLAYLRFLRGADEFLQKLQLEALAIGFGVSIVFAMGYQLFEHVGAPKIEINNLLLVMIAGWMAGQLYGIWKYR